MEDVADGSDLMRLPKIGFKEVTRRGNHSICQSMTLRNSFSHLKHPGPIHRMNAHVWRLFRDANSPNARTSANVQDGDWSFGARDSEVLGQFARSGKAYREKRLNKLRKELFTFTLSIDPSSRPAYAHHFAEIQPAGQKLVADMLKERAIVTWFG